MSLLDNNLINTYKTMVGLTNVDNTTDLNKPINTAIQTALNSELNLTGGTLTGGLTGTTANFSGDVTANGISISSLNSSKLNLTGGTLVGGLTGTTASFSGLLTANGGLTGTTARFSGLLATNGGLTGTSATFSGPLIANGGITGTTANFSGLVAFNGGLTGSTATFSGPLIANGGITGTTANFSGSLIANGGLTGSIATFSGPLIANGGITGTTANFSGLLSAIGGLTGTTATFSGPLIANGSITGTTATFSGDVTANGISISSLNSGKLNLTGGTLVGELTGTTASFSGPLIANGGITGTTASFSGLLTANGSLTGTSANFSGDVIANGISISSLNSNKLNLTGGTLTGTITVPQITDLTLNNNTVATTSFVNSKAPVIPLKLPVDLVSTTNQTLTSTAYIYDISSAAFKIVSTDFSFGTGNFTCEAWVNITDYTTYGLNIFDTRTDGSNNIDGFVLRTDQIGYLGYYHLNSSAISIIAKVELNTLTHIVYQRVGNVIQLYVNGVYKDQVAFNQNLSTTTNLIIGRSTVTSNSNNKFKGYINNIRITKSAVYSGNFTPSQTLTALANTNLLITNSNPVIDISGTNKTITIEGTLTYNFITVAGSWITGIDSVVPAVNNRILFVGQSNQTENGIYVMSNTSLLNRPSDFSLDYAANGTNVFVKSGAQYVNTNWVCTNLTGSDKVGTNNLIFNSINIATDSGPLVANTGITGTTANFSGLLSVNGGLTGTTATFSGPLIANSGITGSIATFSSLLATTGGLTGSTATFSGPLIANGGITGSTATFFSLLAANGGLTGTTATFSGPLIANGGIMGTTASFSGAVTANGISFSSLNSGKLNLTGGTLVGGLTGTSASFSGPLIANGGITGTTATFSGLLTANGGLMGTTANFSGDVIANGISISSLNSNKLNLTGGTLTGTIMVPQIMDLTLNNNTVATTSFVNSKVSAIPLKLPVDLVSTTNQTLTSATYNYDISSGAFRINSTDFASGTGDFTYEAWITLTSLYYNGIGGSIFDTRTPVGNNPDGFYLSLTTSGYIGFYCHGIVNYYTSAKLNLNELTHLVCQRVNNTIQIYTNGVLCTDQMPFNYNFTNTSNLVVGRIADTLEIFNNHYKFKGFINNIRVTKAAVYSGNFTPSQTLSALPNTILLITNTSPVADMSGTNKTVGTDGSFTYNSLTNVGTWATMIDFVVPAVNNRILFVGQTDKKENGIYVVTNSTTLNRSSDFPLNYAANGTNVFVKSGTQYAKSNWVCTNLNGLDIVGIDNLIFNSVNTEAISGQLTAINGITGTTATFSADLTVLGRILCNLTEYADDSAAKTAGLTVGALYRTGESIKIVL